MLHLWFSFFLSLCLPYLQQVERTSQPVGKTVSFKKQVLSHDFLSEGSAVGDFNRDGKMDVVAGAYWYEAPNWTAHAIDTPKVFNPAGEYSNTFLNFVLDVNRDGWPDVIRIDTPGQGAYWYENPKQQQGHWKIHRIHGSICNESPRMVDVNDDGHPDLLFSDSDKGRLVWMEAVVKNNKVQWVAHAISEQGAPGTEKYAHGLGLGDMDGDGRKDVLVREGWYQAPADQKNASWTFHPAALGEPCAQMYTYDFDKDGDMDVVASSAHDYGIWWYEQTGSGWKKHLIYDKFSQSHGLAFADMNGDGLPDLVTGKRYFAHNGKDPGAYEPAVLYWFEYQLNEQGQPVWTPHQVDDNAGVGLQVVVEDMNGDGKPDIVASNKKGVFYFEQR